MKPIHYILTLLVLGSAACSPVKNTMQREWQKNLAYHDDFHAPLTDIVHNDANNTTAVLNPLGLEVVNATGNTVSSISSVRKRSVSFNIPVFNKQKKNVTFSYDRLEKVIYYPMPGHNEVLEFNYTDSRESISLIDLSDGQVKWTNNKVSWNVEKFESIWRFLSDALINNINDPLARARAGAAAGLFFPKKYIEDIVTLIPEKNAMFISSLFGVSLLNLEDGTLIWDHYRGLAAGVSHVHYDPESESIVLFGGNPLWFPVIKVAGIALNDHFQTDMEIMRFDFETGNILWQTQYSSPILARTDGNFDDFQLARETDIRINGQRIFINTRNIEVYDFETGNKAFQSEAGKDFVFSDFNPPLTFSFPVEHDGMIYKTSIERVLAIGVSVGNRMPDNYEVVIEAYNAADNTIAWRSDTYSRLMVNNMSVWNNLLLAGFNKSSGVMAFDAKDGSVVWEYPLGRRGVTTKWILIDDKLVLAANDIIHIINPANGELVRKIEVGKTTGTVENIYAQNNRLIVLGDKKGAAMYNLNDGTLVNAVKTGFNPDLYAIEGKYVLASIFPNEPIIILNKNDFRPVGSLAKSKHRTALAWSEKSGDVFEVRKGRLARYRIK